MVRRIIVLSALAAVGCGGSEEAANTPAQTPPSVSTPPPAPAPVAPSFPGADRFRLGETVTLSEGGAECQKLYFDDSVVAIVQMYQHVGSGAVVRRCVGNAWADAASPTTEELARVGARLDGHLMPQYEGVDVDADGSLAFTELDLAGRASSLALAGQRAAYVSLRNERDAAGGGREADAIAVIYDLRAQVAFQEVLLGTCQVGSPLTLAEPEWAGDERSVVFRGDSDRCSFGEVEVNPE